MDRKGNDILVVGYGLAFIYGIGLFIYLLAFLVSLVDVNYVLKSSLFAGRFARIEHFQKQAMFLWLLFFPQWLGALALLRYKEWGRQLLIAMNLLTSLAILYKLKVLSGAFDFLPSAYVMVSLVIVLYLFQPRVKEAFAEASSTVNRRILVVDDDKGLLKMVKSTLSTSGYEVFTTTTGESGIQLAKKKRPALIILDVILPGIKGREVCVKLKQDEETRQIPVIFLTAKDSPEDVKAEMSAGGLSHITKPVNSQKLLAEIKKIVGV